MKTKDFIIGSTKITAFLPDRYDFPLPAYYFLDGNHALLEKLFLKWEQRYQKKRFAAILVPVENWNRDLSPWYMDPVFPKGEPFQGKADLFLDFLEQEVRPFVNETLPISPFPQQTACIGYSLAGLAALYQACRCDSFGRIGCLSGSLWYEGFLPFFEKNGIRFPDSKIYLSLGDKEYKTDNPILSSIQDNTLKVYQLLQQQLSSEGKVIFEWNSGGHTNQIENRYDKAVSWLIKA